jgi:hypothetical protein
MYATATRDEKLPAFIRSHVETFDLFGGVPHEIVYDNLKSVALARDFDGSMIEWNAQFWDFSRYYGFQPRPHRPYRPQTKGKVESGVKYVKRFLRGKEFASLEHLNEVLAEWIANVADQRIHGTTHRQPAEVFLEERDLLIPHQSKRPIRSRTARSGSSPATAWWLSRPIVTPFLWRWSAGRSRSKPRVMSFASSIKANCGSLMIVVGVRTRCKSKKPIMPGFIKAPTACPRWKSATWPITRISCREARYEPGSHPREPQASAA